MVANIRCAEIAADQLAALQKDQAWLALGQEAATGVVPSFGERAASLISSNLAGALVHASVITLRWSHGSCGAVQHLSGTAAEHAVLIVPPCTTL